MAGNLQVSRKLPSMPVCGERSISVYPGFFKVPYAWNSGNVPALDCPFQNFLGRAVSEGQFWFLTECAQGSQQQWNCLIGLQWRRAVAFPQLVTVGLGDEWHMQITWLWYAEQFLEVQLARRGVEQVGAADNIGHTLQGVVDDNRQLIRVKPVATTDHKVTHFTAKVLLKRALNTILEPVQQFGYANTNGCVIRRVPGISAGTRVNTLKGFELFARAGTRISKAVAEPAIDDFLIGIVAMTLGDQLSIPFKAIAFERFKNCPLSARDFSRRIEVFHAHQPLPTL